ncbi:efflux RND transporter permease subunit [Adhaeretor mobilis]|uniref:Antibiotic efflux pump membrane transporter ArpB n=1 Tax=Adhaeretor mobilis TaxID=1930276 RepID=A0A517MW99_9BACT|nr:efflux RND transporter permease subunit [Adhaeretor mobilis]QDS99148.1 Antibiotic efflux pump membrane transporter ArpB [Adhaeretor mobilis]
MNLIDAFVHNPIKVAVGVLLLTLFGTIALFEMPMQLTPEVEIPTITVTTRWPGASPQEVEREIVVEQEEQLKSVEGLQKLSSASSDSQGVITLEFAVGADIDTLRSKVDGRLNQVPVYPEDADEPVIATSDPNANAIAWFILSALPPSEERIDQLVAEHPDLKSQLDKARNADNSGLLMLRLRKLAIEHPEVATLLPPPELEIPKLKRFVEDEIEARFERVDGVSLSNVIGGLEDEMQVIVDPEKLASRSVTLGQVRDVLRGQNKDTSAGYFEEGKRRYVVRALGEFNSPEHVENQLLAVRDGAPVFVRDVAEVRRSYKKPDGLVRRFGESSIAINCIRETGANVLDVMVGLRKVNEELNRTLLEPRGLQLSQVYDETDYINSSVNLVQQNIFVGGALTMVVLMAFLHLGVRTLIAIPLLLATALAAAYLSPWWFVVTLAVMLSAGFWFARGAMVVGLAIPISIIGTFLVLNSLGRSLNVISLAGLAFAVGMLVDNAVVVLENIYRRFAELEEPPFTAAVRGTQEVSGAVLSSTLTTIAVFLPVVFVQQEAGQLFRDIALAISAAVGLSLIVSVTVIPTASARLFKSGRRSKEEGNEDESDKAKSATEDIANSDSPQDSTSKVLRGVQTLGSRLTGFVVGINDWAQRSALRRTLTIVTLVSLSLGLSWLLWPRVEYLPTGNRNLVIGFVIPPPGYNTDQLMSLGTVVEDELRPYWDVDATTPDSDLDAPAIEDFFFVVRGRSVFLGVRARDPLRSAELVPLVFRVGGKLPGSIAFAQQTSLFERGLGAGRSIDVEISGPDVEKLVGLGQQVFGQVMQVVPGAQARPTPSLDLSSPEVHVLPKLLQAAEMGINSAELGFAVDCLVDGAYVGDYFYEGKKIDLTLIGETRFANQTHLIGAAPVATPIGQLVPLNALADVELSSGPEQINHRERVRSIAINVSPPPDVALEDAMNNIEKEIVAPLRESGALGENYGITLAGTADKLRQTWESLRFNVLMALLITYLLMAALFESWLYPLVVILSVPLGAVGGLLGLRMLNLFVLQPLDVLTMLGFVVLIGTVVNNPILIVHQALNHLREDNMQPREAILESVRTRIRPIFMTTITTVLGLLPLVVFPGAGSELYRGLGSVVLGGLLVSTFFTLILVPTLLAVALDAKALLAGSEVSRSASDHKSPAPRSIESNHEGGTAVNQSEVLPTTAVSRP